MDNNSLSIKDMSESGDNNSALENMHCVPAPKKRKTVLSEPEYGECSTSSQAVNQDDSVSTSEAGTEKKEMDTDHNISMNAAEWPDFVLKLIFRFLCVCNLINVQKVCKSWEKATKDKALWRNIFVGTNGILDMLPTAPYVQNIKGDISEESELNVIKNNVYDLKKMDCTISSQNISSTTFQEFIKKFQNLEFIKINNSTLFMESLKLLSSFPKLKALQLWYNSDSVNFSHFCRLIADGFPALRNLCINQQNGKKDVKDDLSGLIRKKISQLTDLNLSYHYVHRSIFDLIFESTKMRTMWINVENCSEISFNMSKMVNLKSLILEVAFHHDDYTQKLEQDSIQTFETLVFPSSLQHLNLYFDDYIKSPPGIVNSIINFLPNLRVLSISGVSDPDLDQQLQQINDLTHLHTVSFHRCASLSAMGVENILRCAQLRNLKLYMREFLSAGSTYVSFEDTTYDRLQDCKFLGHLELHYCILDLEKLLPTILAMRFLTSLNIRSCKGKKTTGELIHLSWPFITDIIEACKNEKHSVKIECWWC